MIKCNVSVCGTVSKAAVVRNGKDGMPFTTYSVDVVIPAKKGINKTVIVSCIMDGDDAEGIVVGNRIELKGVLTFKKKDDNLYFNLKVSEVNLSPVSESKDGIVGDMEFKGKVGKDIDMKKNKNGKAVLQADNGTTKVTRELTNAEFCRLSQVLGDTNLSNDAKKMRIAGMVNTIVLTQQASQNYEQVLEQQEGQSQTMQRK